MDKAIFPGSFDPFTIGHMDVLHSALQLFDSIIIAVGCNSMKKGLFDTNTRVSIIEDAIAAAGLSNVSVCTYSNLTIPDNRFLQGNRSKLHSQGTEDYHGLRIRKRHRPGEQKNRA